jgi:hypothetical protein
VTAVERGLGERLDLTVVPAHEVVVHRLGLRVRVLARHLEHRSEAIGAAIAQLASLFERSAAGLASHAGMVADDRDAENREARSRDTDSCVASRRFVRIPEGRKEPTMPGEPRTIDDHILCLARLTGASETFVCEVRALFIRRGIALDSNAAPYLAALEDAFLREERTRAVPQPASDVTSPRPAGRAMTVIVPQQREAWPHVPGPDDLQ